MLDIVLLKDGLFIMLLGVGFVLAFLCIMILGMTIMAKVIAYLNKLFPEQVFVAEKPSKPLRVSRLVTSSSSAQSIPKP